MPRWLSVALVLSLLLNAFFVAGFVFRGWIAPLPFEQRMPPPPPPPGGRPGPLEVMANEINLDERQRQMLRGIIDQHAQARRDRSREIQKMREQIVDEYRRIPLDQGRLGLLIDKLGDLRADQQKETVNALSQFEAELKPEQRERMHKVLVDRLLASPWYRPPGGPPPPLPRPSQ
jgi:Spy/CpxP family protein refolding chaperone